MLEYLTLKLEMSRSGSFVFSLQVKTEKQSPVGEITRFIQSQSKPPVLALSNICSFYKQMQCPTNEDLSFPAFCPQRQLFHVWNYTRSTLRYIHIIIPRRTNDSGISWQK